MKDITFKVLGFYNNKEKEWNAVALEMDVWGHGETLQDAYKDLEELVLMQISFALYKGKPEMIWRNADPIYFRHFTEAVASLPRQSTLHSRDNQDDTLRMVSET